ncbi:putative membrane protein [Babesia divergens]|uniref:Membrane protein n=1 Tax=Babesia divergens TaxID=32595 RepID=A0AAD9GJY8_BABDI|nr:putative membrane protein [Babesia divergens]
MLPYLIETRARELHSTRKVCQIALSYLLEPRPMVRRCVKRMQLKRKESTKGATPSHNKWENVKCDRADDNLFDGEGFTSTVKVIHGEHDDSVTSIPMSTVNGSKVTMEDLNHNKDAGGCDPLSQSADNVSAHIFSVLEGDKDAAKTATSLVPSSVRNTSRRQVGLTMPYCSIVPGRNVFRILGNMLASMRLYMIDKNPKYNENPLTLLAMTTASVIPLYITQIAKSPRILAFLRKRWAFQGECGEFSVESVLKSMLNLLAMESGLKLALRVWFYGNNVNWGELVPDFVNSLGHLIAGGLGFIPRSINTLGNGILGGYWSMGALKAMVHMFVHSAVFARLVLFTAAQHAFFQENYDTAAFLINPIASQFASILSAFLFAMASTSNIGTMLMLKNFSNLADVEHLLDYTGFRTTESHAAATGYARNAVHNIPKMLKPTSLDILVKLSYYHEYLSQLIPRGVEWPVLLLHMTLALNSNSAAGLYLALVNLIYAVINQRLSSYERSILTQDIQEIVQESR